MDDVVVLKNAEMAEGDLLPMAEAIEVVESAFAELGEGRAKNEPRARIHVEEGGPPEDPDTWYWFNNIMGAVPGQDAMALRIDSGLRRIVDVGADEAEGEGKMTYPGDFVGLVLLFDIRGCGLLAVMDDHYLSPLRVAATSAVATDRLAREDASNLGLVGAGEQAEAMLEAVATVRDVESVRVYSPTPESRESFAEEMTEATGVPVTAVSDPESAVRDADIVNLATSATDPVLDGDWLAEGAHVNSIVGGDSFHQRQELDDRTVERADRMVVNLLEQVYRDEQGDLYPRLQSGLIAKAEIDELAALVAGEVPGRESREELTVHKNNTGMGIQFAATAERVYRNAEGTGLGRTLPADLFVTRNEDGYSP
jgi:alanine dehydrogenase